MSGEFGVRELIKSPCQAFLTDPPNPRHPCSMHSSVSYLKANGYKPRILVNFGEPSLRYKRPVN